MEDQYQKIEKIACSRKQSLPKKSLKNAKLACDNLDGCQAVEDTNCDNDSFYTCEKGTAFKSLSQSCVYNKIKGKIDFGQFILYFNIIIKCCSTLEFIQYQFLFV